MNFKVVSRTENRLFSVSWGKLIPFIYLLQNNFDNYY